MRHGRCPFALFVQPEFAPAKSLRAVRQAYFRAGMVRTRTAPHLVFVEMPRLRLPVRGGGVFRWGSRRFGGLTEQARGGACCYEYRPIRVVSSVWRAGGNPANSSLLPEQFPSPWVFPVSNLARRSTMFAKTIKVGLVGTALLATAAFAQSPTATTDRANMAPAAASDSSSYQGDWRSSKLV